ncbi:MAG: hypothetical protein WBZ36_30075, partial [Candidatus Nitrosopolaris sp.]
SSIMRPTLVFELVFEKYPFTYLIATFNPPAWDSPRDDNAPLNGSRAPNVGVHTDMSHAEQAINSDTSHVAQSLIYLPQIIR